MESYTNTLGEILNCGIGNNLEGSKYANSDYYVKVWEPTLADFTVDVLDVLGLWYYPALSVFFIFSTWWFSFFNFCTVMNIVFMWVYHPMANMYFNRFLMRPDDYIEGAAPVEGAAVEGEAAEGEATEEAEE